MAELKQRSLEEVKALSVEDAVEIMRQAGIVGAGGGGVGPAGEAGVLDELVAIFRADL